ncbi:MAG: alanine--glyoxylate aminotransferase family protein [Bacteroidota bacterium]
MHPQRLFIPGPTPIPPDVLKAMAQQPVSHKSDEFKAIFKRTTENLQKVFKTENPVLTLTCSGTGAAEAAAQNLVSKGDKALVIINGRFAQRWSTMLSRLETEVIELHAPWGEVFKSEEIRKVLKENPDCKTVWITHSETSTGILNDIEIIAKTIHEYSDALICVDAVSSVAGCDIQTDNWKLDIVFSASQKGLMSPAGLGFVALSERAWKITEQNKKRGLYFDLLKARESLQEFVTPWTPAIHSIFALDEALKMILNEGLDNVFARHARNSMAMRESMVALGLKVFNEASPSPALTVVELPRKKFIDVLKKETGITVASGQDDWKDVAFRIGHLGWYFESDILFFIESFEKALLKTNRKFEKGVGIAAAENVFKS